MTLEQAVQAGALATGITQLNDAIAGLQARIDGGAVIRTMAAELEDGTSVRAAVPMTAEDSAAVLTAVKTVCETKRDALLVDLAAITG